MKATGNTLFGVACLVLAAVGCSSPEAYPLLDSGRERAYREVEPLDTDRFASGSESIEEAQKKEKLDEIVSGLASAEKAAQEEITLVEMRQMAIANNLGLKAQFYAPTLARLVTDVQKAKFEATFNIAASQQKTFSEDYNASATSSSSTPTVTLENQFSDVETKTTSIAPSLEVPLVTGGSITLGPTFSSVESTSRSTEIFSGGTTDKSDSTDDSYGLSAGVALTQPLLRNAGVEYNQGSIVLAMYQERVADVRTRLAVVNLLYQVEQAYWSVYMSARTLEVQLSQYDLYKKELDDARKLRAGGVNTIADVYGFEAGVASQVARVVEADNHLRQSARALKLLVQDSSLPMDWDAPIKPTTPPSLVRYDLDVTELIKAGLTNRMELLEGELQIAADALNIRLAENQTLPQLDVNLGYTWQGFSGSSWGDARKELTRGNDPDGWFMGLTASIPLGNAAAEANLQAAIVRRLRSIANQRQREVTVTSDVLNALDALHASWMELISTRYAVQASNENLKAEQKLFKLGNRTSNDVTQALLQLGAARIAELDSEIDYQLAMAQLASATGTFLGYSSIEWSPSDRSTELPEPENIPVPGQTREVTPEEAVPSGQ